MAEVENSTAPIVSEDVAQQEPPTAEPTAAASSEAEPPSKPPPPAASAAETTTKNVDAAPTKASSSSASIEFEPPAACVRRLLKAALPKSTNVSKDSLAAISRASGIFVLYLTACANDVAREGRRTTIVAKDVMGALKELDFEEFVPLMEKFLEVHRKEVLGKKEEKERLKKEKAGLGEDGRDSAGKFVAKDGKDDKDGKEGDGGDEAGEAGGDAGEKEDDAKEAGGVEEAANATNAGDEDDKKDDSMEEVAVGEEATNAVTNAAGDGAEPSAVEAKRARDDEGVEEGEGKSIGNDGAEKEADQPSAKKQKVDAEE